MTLVEFPLAYLVWHYTTALRKIFEIGFNFIWYTIYLFSIPLLVRTLFSPWKRVTETYAGGGLEEFMSIVVMNIFSHIFGFFVRVPIVIIGCVCAFIVFVCLCIFYVLWLVLPVVLVGLISYGLVFLHA